MRVLLVTHIFPPAIDGGSHVIAKMGEYLNRNGHEILVLTTDCSSTDDFVNSASKPILSQSKGQSAKAPSIYRLPVHKRLRRPLKAIQLFLSLFLNHESWILHLLSILQKGPIFKLIPFLSFLVFCFSFRPDLIISGPLPTTIVLYARLIRFLTKAIIHLIPKLLINSSFHPTDPDFQKTPLIKTLQSADFLWTLSDFETDYFINKLNIDLSKILQLGNGIDSSFLSHKSCILNHNANLLFVGSFATHKNLCLLIDAFAILLKRHSANTPKPSLTLAGQKTLYWPLLQQKIDELPSDTKDRIKIIFSFPQNLKADIYDQASVLIRPSLEESFGLTLIEAWARQKPVIVSDIPVFKELIDKSQGGLIFDKTSPSDLASKIQTLINNPNLGHKLALNGFAYTKSRFLWDKIVDSLCQKIGL